MILFVKTWAQNQFMVKQKNKQPPIMEEPQGDWSTRHQQVDSRFSVFNRKQMRKQKKEQKKLNHIEMNQRLYMQNKQLATQPRQGDRTNAKQSNTLPDLNVKKKQNRIAEAADGENGLHQRRVLKTKEVESSNQQKRRQPKQFTEEEDKQKLKLLQGIEEEEENIEKLKKKLKLKNDRLTKTMIELDGLDDDLFDLLDHIDQSVKLKEVTKDSYKRYTLTDKQSKPSQKGDLSEADVEDDENAGESNENKHFDNEDELDDGDDESNEPDRQGESEEVQSSDIDDDDIEPESQGINEEQMESEEESEAESKNSTTNNIPNKQIKQPVGNGILKRQQVDNQETSSGVRSAANQNLPSTEELKKSLNRNINKLSETNINSIMDEIVKICDENPKQTSAQVFAQCIVQSTVKARQLLPYLLSCLTAASCYLHQLYDNLFFQEIVRAIMQILRTTSEPQEVKHITLIFCHWYVFESISLDFIKEFIIYLCERFNADNVENLINIILYLGKKIRTDNPTILKQIIESIKAAAERNEQDSRTQFLLMTLNDLRMNKKINSQAERLEFLINWHKQRKQRLIPRVFPASFNSCLNSQFESNSWWQPIPSKEEQTQLYQEFFQSKKNANLSHLEKLAAQAKMVTDTRKNIFVIIMGADDIFEATENLSKIGYLKKKKQDVAMVVLEMCGNEKNFNAYYPELALSLIHFERGMKQQFQYAAWDKFKLIGSYDMRKQVNIARFVSYLLKKQGLNLLMLKWFNFSELDESTGLFIYITLHNFLKKISLDTLAKQCKNLFEKEEYLTFRASLENFMKHQFKNYRKQQRDEDPQISKDAKIMIQLLKDDPDQNEEKL